jgi:hypothetical protein
MSEVSVILSVPFPFNVTNVNLFSCQLHSPYFNFKVKKRSANKPQNPPRISLKLLAKEVKLNFMGFRTAREPYKAERTWRFQLIFL